MLACSLFHQGVFDQALGHAEEALSRWTADQIGWRTAAYGENPGVSCHTWAALALWFLGFPDAARGRAEEAVRLSADRPELMHARAFACAQAAIIDQLRLDPEACLGHADGAVEAGTEGGYTLRLAAGVILRGWALAALGRPGEGIPEIVRGIELSRATGARMDDAYYLGLLADARARARLEDDAQSALDEALDVVRGSRTFFYEPELHRLRAEVLAASGRPDAAEASVREALRIARTQGAPSLELRAAVTLVDLVGDQGPLAAVYSRFTEGFESPDLRRAAEALGVEMGEPPRGPPAAPSSAIVGREAERTRLRELLREVLGGEQRMVFVTGEPGIGKTTLVEAFQAEAAFERILVARGQCLDQYGAGEPYLPLLEALGRTSS